MVFPKISTLGSFLTKYIFYFFVRKILEHIKQRFRLPLESIHKQHERQQQHTTPHHTTPHHTTANHSSKA